MLNQIFIPWVVEKKQVYHFQTFDFTNDEDWEAQNLGSASS
jgi:hypothetical protein